MSEQTPVIEAPSPFDGLAAQPSENVQASEQQNSQQIPSNDSNSGQSAESKGADSNSAANAGKEAEKQQNQVDYLSELSGVAGQRFGSLDDAKKWASELAKAKSETLEIDSQPYFKQLKSQLNKAKSPEEFKQRLKELADRTTTDYAKEAISNPDRVILEAMKLEFPDLPDEDIKLMLARKYPGVGEDQEPDEDVRAAKNRAILAEKRAEASKLAKNLIQKDIEWIEQQSKPEPTAEDMYLQTVEKARKPLIEAAQKGALKGIKIGELDYSFDFGEKGKPSANLKLVNAIHDEPFGEHGLGRWWNPQTGEIDLVKLAQDRLKLENLEKVAQFYGSNRESKTNKEIQDEISNPSSKKPIERNGSPSKGKNWLTGQ